MTELNLKPQIQLINSQVVVSVGSIAKVEIDVVDLLQAIVDATPTEKDNALFLAAKAPIELVLATLSKKEA